MPAVTFPLSPAEPSSVQTNSSSQHDVNLSSQNTRSRVRKPRTPMTYAPCSLEAARLRKNRRHAEAAADAEDLLRVPERARHAHRSDHAMKRGADAAGLLHFPGRLADGLNDQRDRAGVGIEVGDGERDALAVLVRHDHHELARPGRPREQRVRNLRAGT